MVPTREDRDPWRREGGGASVFNTTLSPPEWFIKTGSGGNHFKYHYLRGAKSLCKTVSTNHNFWRASKLKRAGTRTEVRRAGQPNTVPLGQTGLHQQQQNCSVLSFLLPPHPRPTVRCDPLAWRKSASPIATMYREAGSATGSSLARPEDAARIFVRKLRNRLPQASFSVEFEKASVSERDRRRGVQTTENNTDRFALTRRS